MVVTARKVLPIAFFAVLPLTVTLTALWVAQMRDIVAIDFHNELYKQAQDVLDWMNPYPASDADVSSGANAIWPIFAVFLVMPLALLPAAAADWVMTALELGCLGAALWILRVRDWRVYGSVLLWPPVINAVQTANATLPLAVLCALTWRYRRHALATGTAVGCALAVKFFLWPLVVWLAATRRWVAASLSIALGAGSLLLILPFYPLTDYAELVRNLSRTFDHESYTVYGLLMELGAPSQVARVSWILVGLTVLVLAVRRQSFVLSVGAALLLTPIAWLHFFAILVVPLAIVQPTLSFIWLVPLTTWAAAGSGNGESWQQVIVLASSGCVLGYCAHREATADDERGRAAVDEPCVRRRAIGF